MTLTLVATNGYLVDSNLSDATLFILDNLAMNVFVPVVTNLRHPLA